MAKFNLLLVDANIVIYLFEIGLWEEVLAQCDVHLSETILREALFYTNDDGDQLATNIESYRARMTVHPDVQVSEMQRFLGSLGGSLLERMDAGEAEILCILSRSLEPYTICSADAAVFRYLGAARQSAQGVSLEEVLTGIGRARQVSPQYRKRFKDEYCRRGFEEGWTQNTYRGETT